MADVDDPNHSHQLYQNQLDKLKDADIPEQDREAVMRLVRWLDQRDREASTIGNHINNLRLSSERANLPLVEMEREDVDAFLFDLNHEHGLSEGTVRNYRKSLRLLFRESLERDWAEDIEIGASPERKVDPNDLLEDDQIDALFDAARNSRDKALLAVLLDTGLRIAAIASLRIRDIELSKTAGTLTINQDATGRKDAAGTVPITWSRSYLANWLEMHPQRTNDDAALLHRIHANDEDFAEGDGALSTPYLRKQLNRIADRAGVPTEKTNPHNFRKTAISRWIREGFSEQEIKHRAMWTKDSSQFDVYSGVTNEELNEQILEKYGLADEESTGRPTMEACPSCGAPLRGSESFCPSCATALTDKAAASMEAAEDTASDGIRSSDTVDQAVFADAFRRMLEENPEWLPEDAHQQLSSMF